MDLSVPGCCKPPMAAASKCAIGSMILDGKEPGAMVDFEADRRRFIVAFCGSGTGHLTQAMKVVEMLQDKGMVLAAVVTDSDASDKMLDELVRPLGVELLIIPAIQLVDTEKGFVPLIAPHRFIGSLMHAQGTLHEKRHEYAQFFVRAKASKIYNMYHLTLARFFQLNPLPPSMSIVHMAAQFGLCALTHEDTRSFIEVGGKAVMDVMAGIFAQTGQTIPIGPLGTTGTLPPIIHIPAPLASGTKRLIICYFLVATNASALDDILAREPMPGVEFHCFTANPLEKTRSQLHSHQKQRKLFQELFAKCTGVIVSAGNETVGPRSLRRRARAPLAANVPACADSLLAS